MPRKRHTPNLGLQTVIEALEREDMAVAVAMLLAVGPLEIPHEIQVRAVTGKLAPHDHDMTTTGAELLAFLRGLVRVEGRDVFSRGIGLRGHATFSAGLEKGEVVLRVDAGVRDASVLQLLSLLQAVGLRNVRFCDCGRLFVKVYRREYCSAQCQHRVWTKQRRESDRRKRAQARMRRERAKVR